MDLQHWRNNGASEIRVRTMSDTADKNKHGHGGPQWDKERERNSDNSVLRLKEKG